MILNSTTRKLQALLGEATVTTECAVVASYFDSAAVPGGGPALINTNGVTAVDIVAAPAASTIRQVNEITVFNADTVTHKVTIRYNDNSTLYIITKATLLAGETLTYSKSLGWHTLAADGGLKQSLGGSTANLSDYAEGLWTPTIAFGGGATGLTYSAQKGFYTRIGNRVLFQCDVSLSAKGSSTGAASLGGLPFPSANVSGAYVAATPWVGPLAAGVTPLFYLAPNSSALSLSKLQTGGTTAALTDSDFTNSTEVMLMGHYRLS